MKRTILYAGLALGLFSTTVAAQAMTLDELIAKNIETRGGLDKLKSVQSVKMTGKASQGGFETPMTITMMRPKMIRVEVNIQGQQFIMAYDGSSAWGINPFSGSTDPVEIADDEAQDVIDQSDLDGPFVDSKAKGYTIELIGQEDLEGTPVYKLKVVNKRNEVDYFYLDAETGIELKKTSIRSKDGNEIETETLFGDYKEVGGLLFPHSFENRYKGQVVNTMTIDKIEVNPTVTASMFQMPAAAPTADAASSDAASKAPTTTKKKN